MNESLLDKMIGPSEEEILNSYHENPKNFIKHSIENGFLKGVELAIKNGYDVNTKYVNFLHIATLYNRKEIAKLLIDNGIEFNSRAVRAAYENGYKDLGEYVLERFGMTFRNYLIKYPQDYLYLSVVFNKLEEVKKAINLGADVNVNLDMLLFNAVIKHYNNVAICLLLHGAKIDKYVLDGAKSHRNNEMIELLKNY